MERANVRLVALSTLVVAVLTGGCDPKFLNGVSDNTHDGTGGGSGTPQQVSREAVITGAVIAFQTELLAGALTVAGDFDAAGPSPQARSFLTTNCMTITVVDAQTPISQFDLNGCTDANGTSYFGVGQFTPPLDLTDAFVLTPDYSDTGVITASNDAQPDLHHAVSSGSLRFDFQRNNGTSTGLVVSNFLRHYINATPNVSFSYDGVTFTGGIGEMGPYPDNGGLIHVAWDGVGTYDVQFDGGPSASFRLQGLDYQVDLSTGAVRLAAQQGV